MKVWPFGAALRGEAPNRLMLRWLKTVVVSDEEKAPGEASGRGQEDDHCLKRRKRSGVIRTGVQLLPRDEPGGCLLTGQAVSGVEVT